MPTSKLSIKPNNHRIYKCPSDKKIELLTKIITDNSNMNILVACSKDAQMIKEALQNTRIKVMEDRDLVKDKELSCEMLVSYDLPIKNIVYMARVAKATKKAIMLLDESEQKELYQIEMLLGRVIKQDSIDGFMYEKVAPKEETTRKSLSKEQIKEVAKKRYEEKTAEPKEKKYEKRPYDEKSPKKEYKKDFSKSNSSDKWAKKKKAPNKFLGKDENGKAIFSGKSGERNHRYDGTPKTTGRTISIKALKPKKD